MTSMDEQHCVELVPQITSRQITKEPNALRVTDVERLETSSNPSVMSGVDQKTKGVDPSSQAASPARTVVAGVLQDTTR